MRLKRIEILGFKSFADKTKLEFDPGITAVVGPNGCGKSNIADAFRWVMGEQSAKSMRGTKMPDVIFAGTTHRKPLNFAEVTIVLGDVQEELPIAYDEVAITRRLHRSGESEYFINRHPVRLKDVQSLLLDTGLGKDAYSIFEQGEIDRVINLPPLERRYIFEEAAGILRFLQRKKEALRKLEQTDQNVSRIKDIHQEVEKQIIVLEEQAEKARQYKSNRRLYEDLEKAFILAKRDQLNGRLQEHLRKSDEHEHQIADTNTQLNTLLHQLQEAKQSQTEAENVLLQSRENVFKARSHKEIKTKEKTTNQERLKEIESKHKRCQVELENMHVRRTHREGERQQLLKQQKELERQYQDAEHTVLSQREKVKVNDEELHIFRQKQQQQQREHVHLIQEANLSEGELKNISMRLEHAREKHDQLNEQQERFEKSIKDLQGSQEEKKSQLEQATDAIETQKETFNAMEHSLEEVSEEISKNQTEFDRITQEIAESTGRQKALLRLRDDMEGFSVGSKKIIQEAANAKSPLYQKVKGLYEYFTPKKGVETAIGLIMKPYAQTLAVETPDDLDLVVKFAHEHQIKDISLFCVETMRKHVDAKLPTSEFSSLALQVVENEVSNHFLRHVAFAKEQSHPIEVIQKAHGVEVWAGKSSAFVDRHQVIFYAGRGDNNIFLREAELKALESKLNEAESRKLHLENVLRLLQQRRTQLQAERIELDKAIRRAEMRAVEMKFALQKTTADLEKTSAERKLISTELRSIATTIETFTLQLSSLNTKYTQAKEIATRASQKMDDFNLEGEKLSSIIKHESSLLREREEIFQKISENKNKLAHALNVLDVKDIESEQQERRLEEDIETGSYLKEQILENSSEVDQLLIDAEHALSEAMSACKDLEVNLQACKKTVEFIENKLNEMRNVLKKQETERHQSTVHAAQVESHIQSLDRELQEKYQLSLEEARKAQSHSEMTIEQIEKQIRHIKQQLDSAGDINMTSIEECDKHKTRYQFLNQQIDDLDLSKKELIAIITELDGQSRTIFQKTFEQISANFKKNFQILFNGGEADLQFTESADVLEAGIEIIAKPPGKQMRSINLLSGGEKCLTAMALLFAIFEVKPAPFCILDEIDAPLDDTNVERFVNIVKLFADRCQFIIITHNKRTMAIADILFGVSMQERGVSKLLSMDFSKGAALSEV